MAIKTGDNFLYRGKKPLDSRDSFDTILAMTTFAESSIDEGHISYVKETDKYYKFNSTNTVDMTLGKWREYNGGGGSSTDEKVKLDATSTDAKYLNELIDNSTIEVDATNNCLVVKKIDGQTATVAEINFLTGVTSNIQAQIDNLGKSMTMYGVFGTKADLLASTTPTPVDGNTAIVIADEDNNNKQMTYIYIASNSAWTQVAESSVTVRDFTTEPINLATETTGTLHKSKIDAAIARLADVLDKATYKGTGDGIVKQADKLTGLTATIAALNQAVTDSHTHSNKAVLDKIVSNGIGSGFLADNGKYISILHIGTTSPTYDSQIWIDNTDSSKPILKIFDGTNWVTISGSSSGSGTSITVDSAMSDTSTNPVQNKVIKAYVDSKSVDISADLDNAIQNKTDGIYVEKTKISTDDGNALSKKSNGLFVQDLSDKINQINFAQKTVNEGLDYCYCTLGDAISGQTYSINDTFPFTMSKSNNMTCNSSNHSIILKKGKTYRISSDIQCNLTSANMSISIYNLTKGMNLRSFHKTVNNTASESAGTAIYTPDLDDEEIIVKIISLTGTVKGTKNPTDFSYFIAEEIGRAITIDPLEYANSESGIEDTPVGSVISYLGINIPKHYLPCDGRIYNITDYPHLAEFFKDNYGDASVFGGDGITTFGVPTRDVKINKIDLVPEMASNSQGGYVLTSSSIYSADYVPYQAFDKNKHSIADSTFATANDTTTGWIQIEFPQKEIVTEFSLQARVAGRDSERTSFIDFQLLGSNDGTNFNTLFSITGEPAWSAGEIREYELTSKNRYKYYRLNVSKSSGTPYVDIQEIGLFKIAKEQYIIKAEPTYYMELNQCVNYTDEEIREAVSAVLGGTE